MSSILRSTVVAVVVSPLLVWSGMTAAHEAHDHASGPAAGYAFPLPEPGSYRLPPLRFASGGSVLKQDGDPVDLGALLRDRITVFSFIYTRCADLCPLATARLAQFQDLAAEDPELDEKLQLLSISFDPDHDTPKVMAEYASAWSRPEGGPEWLFITTSGSGALAPILKAYDQAVDVNPDAADPTGGLNHVLRAFLIDAGGAIRNVYSLDFLDPELVLTDVRTLLLE
jgi:cytochrome oxidase Cu insertion factor (SCO1/SenC/PrrC family)